MHRLAAKTAPPALGGGSPSPVPSPPAAGDRRSSYALSTRVRRGKHQIRQGRLVDDLHLPIGAGENKPRFSDGIDFSNLSRSGEWMTAVAQALQAYGRSEEDLRIIARFCQLVPLCSSLSEGARIGLARCMKFKRLRKGFILSGKSGEEEGCYIVFSGEVLLRSKFAFITRRMELLECCGELPFLDPQLESPTAFTAAGPQSAAAAAEVVFIPRSAFERFVQPIAARRLAERVFVLRQLDFFNDIPDSDNEWRQRQQERIRRRERGEDDVDTSPSASGWSKQRLAELNTVLKARRMCKGEVLQRQGEKSGEIIFVWSGGCVLKRVVDVLQHNSWPVVEYEADGSPMDSRTTGFPVHSQTFAKRNEVVVRKVGPGDFVGDACLRCFVERFDGARRQQSQALRRQRLARTQAREGGGAMEEDEDSDSEGERNILQRWAADIGLGLPRGQQLQLQAGGGLTDDFSEAAGGEIGSNEDENGTRAESASSSEGGGQPGDDDTSTAFIPAAAELEAFTVVCETDGEVLCLEERMLPYLLHRDNLPLVKCLHERREGRPARVALASLIRMGQRKRKCKKVATSPLSQETQALGKLASSWKGGCAPTY